MTFVFSPNLAATVLDAPHLQKLLGCIPNLLDEEIIKEHALLQEQYKQRLIILYESRIASEALAAHQRTIYMNQLRTIQVRYEYPFMESIDNLKPLNLNNQLAPGLEILCSPLLRTAKICFPNRPISCVTSVEKALEATLQQTFKNQIEIREILDDCLVKQWKTTRYLRQIEKGSSKLANMMDPVAQRYLDAFSEYMRMVIDSLFLKLQIIEMETKLQIIDRHKMEELREIGKKADGAIDNLDGTISLGATNLLLFQQLGSSVAKLAQQYHQILGQIKLVKEDLAQLF